MQNNTIFVKKTETRETICQDIISSIIDKAFSYLNDEPLSKLLSRNQLVSPFSKSKNTFRVMSYNILADSLHHQHEEDKRPPYETKYFDWRYRAPLLVSEIQAYNPDILSLQEVDADNKTFHENFQDKYHIYYVKRTQDKHDGCMTLIKKSRYEVLEAHYLEYFHDVNDPVLNKDNVCLILVLQSLSAHDNSILIVANTHLLFNHNRGEIKISQIYLALKACSDLASKYKKKDVNIIYTGDFNSTPQSAIYEFIKRGEFDFREVRGQYLSGQKLGAFVNTKWFRSIQDFLIAGVNKYRYNDRSKEERLEPLRVWLTHLKKINLIFRESHADLQKIEFDFQDMNLEFNPYQNESWMLWNDFYMMSAYGNFQKFYYGLQHKKYKPEVHYPNYSTFEPLYTHRTAETLLTVDYIWYCSRYSHKGKKLKLSAVYELPHLDQGLKVHVFPNKTYPSDHLSLIADFEMD